MFTRAKKGDSDAGQFGCLKAVWLAVCQGWAIPHEDIEICRHPDGTQWLLVRIFGAVKSGTYSQAAGNAMPHVMALHTLTESTVRTAGSHPAQPSWMPSCTTQLNYARSSCANDCWVKGKGAYGHVYKALRGGVQDVAVKQLVHGGTRQLQKFSEVRVAPTLP